MSTPTALSALTTIVKALELLDESQLRVLNSTIVGRITAMTRSVSREKVNAFHHGQMVTFQDRRGRMQTMQVQRLNDKSISGVQIGGDRPGLKWRVHPSFCKAVVHTPTPTTPTPAPALKRELLPAGFGDF